MSNWGFLENILSGVNKYSTVIGCIWLYIVFIFRILVYVAAAEHVWKDENKDFVCNIQQPGCENVCFDHFFPISACGPSSSSWCPLAPCWWLYTWPTARTGRGKRHGKNLVFKTTFEVGSLLAFYFLYSGFDVPRLLRCSLDSCPNTVDCYTAKATEVFLYIMSYVYIPSKQCWKCFSKHYIPIEERASLIIYLLITFGIMFMLKSKIQLLCFHFQC
uniref:Gap junction protein beta 7 n=1 Tax=Oncorhynchus kisutch TaxID=8019 RepID=A0A8C7KPG6_ONCKI